MILDERKTWLAGLQTLDKVWLAWSPEDMGGEVVTLVRMGDGHLCSERSGPAQDFRHPQNGRRIWPMPAARAHGGA